MRHSATAFMVGALLLAACTTAANPTTTTVPSTSTTLTDSPQETYVLMMRDLTSDIDQETWIDSYDDEDLAGWGETDCYALDNGVTVDELAESVATTEGYNFTPADLTLAFKAIETATLTICPQHNEAWLEWEETVAASETSSGFPVPVENAHEAFCTGLVRGTESFSEGMEGVEYFELFGGITWDECMVSTEDFITQEAANNGVDPDDIPLDMAYLWGCKIPVTEYDIATNGPLDEDSLLDAETRTAINEASCLLPFKFAYELDIEWDILRSGVCYYSDHDFSDEQIESGMIRCPTN